MRRQQSHQRLSVQTQQGRTWDRSENKAFVFTPARVRLTVKFPEVLKDPETIQQNGLSDDEKRPDGYQSNNKKYQISSDGGLTTPLSVLATTF